MGIALIYTFPIICKNMLQESRPKRYARSKHVKFDVLSDEIYHITPFALRLAKKIKTTLKCMSVENLRWIMHVGGELKYMLVVK